jgi:hypothetical protein
MKLLVLLAFAGTAVLAMPVGAETQAKGDRVKDAAAPCLKEPEPKQPANQLDFAGNSNGLVFDPFAPGGARPATPSGNQRVGVDPTTVTLFPPTTEQPTVQPKEEDHDQKPCP